MDILQVSMYIDLSDLQMDVFPLSLTFPLSLSFSLSLPPPAPIFLRVLKATHFSEPIRLFYRLSRTLLNLELYAKAHCSVLWTPGRLIRHCFTYSANAF